MLLLELSDPFSDSSSESEMELEQVSHPLLLFKFIYFIIVLFHLSFYFPWTKLISGSVKNKLQIKIACCSLAGRAQLILGLKEPVSPLSECLEQASQK